MAFLTGWAKRIKITADKDVVDSDLSHFPLTVRLGTAVGIGDVDTSCVFDELTSDANRKKIAVTKSDGETQLKVEIEKWDDANEKAVLHCGITGDTLSSSADTDYYLYYDSSHAANTDYVGDTNSEVAESVWDSNFKMVQHMADATTSTTYDSTSNDNDGTKLSANNPLEATGKIGEGQDFSSDYINSNSSAISSSLDITAEVTLEAWVYSDADGAWQTIVSRRGGIAAAQYGMSKEAGNKIGFAGGATGGCWWWPGASNTTIPTNGWTYVTVTWKNSDTSYAYYFNGEGDGNGTYANHGITSQGHNVGIGKNVDDSYYPETFNGDIDEVRISNIVRTADWIKASYNSGNDSLLTYGSEEAAPSVDTGNFFNLFN